MKTEYRTTLIEVSAETKEVREDTSLSISRNRCPECGHPQGGHTLKKIVQYDEFGALEELESS